MPFLFPEYEVSENIDARGHDLLKSSFGDFLGATAAEAWNSSASSSIARITETLDWAPQVADLYGGLYDADRSDVGPGPRLLTAEDWRTSPYHRQGLAFPNGVNERVAQIMAERYDERQRRQDVISRAPSSLVKYPAALATSLLVSLADPLNVASAFIPVVPQAAYGTWAAKYGATAARAMTGAIEGAAGMAMLEPLTYAAAKIDQDPDYNFYDSLRNVAFGGIFGGGLHVGAGLVGDFVAKKRYETRVAALRSAISQIAEGRRVDVEPIFRMDGGAEIPKAYQMGRDEFVLAMVPKEIQERGGFFEKVVLGKSEGLSPEAVGMAKERFDAIQNAISDATSQHERLVADAIAANKKDVPPHVIEEYAGRPWADGVIAEARRKAVVGDVEALLDDGGVLAELRRQGISLDSVRADYGPEGVTTLNRAMPGIVRRGGAPLDVLAADYGFESADALFEHVKNRKTKAQAIEDFMNAESFSRWSEEPEVEASLEDGLRYSREVERQGVKNEPGSSRQAEIIQNLETDVADGMRRVEEMLRSGVIDEERASIMLDSIERAGETSRVVADALDEVTECFASFSPFAPF